MAQTIRTRTELRVAPREVLGKKVKALRRQGLTPANIYGHNVESQAIQVATEELKHVLKSAGRNDIVYLRLDGDDPRPTFVRDVQQHPVTDAIQHIDFLQISLREKVRADVPIHLTGLSPAVDTYGGILMHGLDHVTVEALPTEVPSFLEIDVSPLTEINQALHVSDLDLPDEVTLLTDPEQVVAKVAPPAVEPVEEVPEEEELEEGEAAPEGEEGAAPEQPAEESADSE
ncbi:MAG: 50S ribosomal protein L25 [Chloroflexi bacterium]|nr:MAG: 50S ribosomal protein L25 [Chloroflexota bacterium]TMG03342.1 MAG: 50S ribosomal protein L25 [Chloroflexota bacterium]